MNERDHLNLHVLFSHNNGHYIDMSLLLHVCTVYVQYIALHPLSDISTYQICIQKSFQS